MTEGPPTALPSDEDALREALPTDRYGETAKDRLTDFAENGVLDPQLRADLRAILALQSPRASDEGLADLARRARELLNLYVGARATREQIMDGAILAMISFARPEKVSVTDARAQLAPEYLAMSPLQKWDTLALQGLLGTDEPWIEDMRETLAALQRPHTSTASVIEAASAGETRSGSTEGESAIPKGDAQ